MRPRFYVEGGDGKPLQHGQQLCESQQCKIFVVVLDESFQGRVKTADYITEEEEAETDTILCYIDIKKPFQSWKPVPLETQRKVASRTFWQ